MYLRIVEISYEDGKKIIKQSNIESKQIIETWELAADGVGNYGESIISFEFDNKANDRIFRTAHLKADKKEVVIFYMNDSGKTIGKVPLVPPIKK